MFPAAPVTPVVAVTVVVAIALPVVPGYRIADTHERPASRNPISIGIVAGCPFISRSRAWRHIGRRSADVDTPLGRLGRRCRHAQSPSHYRCTQHPLRHAFHRTLHPT